MKEKKTVELCPLTDCGSIEKKPDEYPRKWKLKTASFLKSVFKFVMCIKVILDGINKFLQWLDEL